MQIGWPRLDRMSIMGGERTFAVSVTNDGLEVECVKEDMATSSEKSEFAATAHGL